MVNSLLESWRAGRAAYGFWMGGSDPYLAGLAALSQPDFILVDMQHGTTGRGALPAVVAEAQLRGVPVVVRVPSSNAGEVGWVLDIGAIGVIFPMVATREQAEAAVRACRYAPRGDRSYGPIRTFLGTEAPEDVEQVACIVMIEAEEGVKNVAAIASTPGVDAILIGPADLAISLGENVADPGPRHSEAIEAVLAAGRLNNVTIGFPTQSGASARLAVARGFGMVIYSSDVDLLLGAAAQELETARAK